MGLLFFACGSPISYKNSRGQVSNEVVIQGYVNFLLHAHYKICTSLINHSMYDLSLSLVEMKSFLWHNLPTNIYIGGLEGAQFLACRNLDFCDFLVKISIFTFC